MDSADNPFINGLVVAHLVSNGLDKSLVDVARLHKPSKHGQSPLAVVHCHANVKPLIASKHSGLGRGEFCGRRNKLLGGMASNLTDELVHVNGLADDLCNPCHGSRGQKIRCSGPRKKHGPG